jgi:hypothetical protein
MTAPLKKRELVEKPVVTTSPRELPQDARIIGGLAIPNALKLMLTVQVDKGGAEWIGLSLSGLEHGRIGPACAIDEFALLRVTLAMSMTACGPMPWLQAFVEDRNEGLITIDEFSASAWLTELGIQRILSAARNA